MAKSEALFWARRPIQYGPREAVIPLDRGQVTELGDFSPGRDEQLVRLGFLAKVENAKVLEPCGKCGARFTEGGFLKAHGDLRHSRKKRYEIEAVRQGLGAGMSKTAESTDADLLLDVTGDAAERRLELDAPLYLDKTMASQRD